MMRLRTLSISILSKAPFLSLKRPVSKILHYSTSAATTTATSLDTSILSSLALDWPLPQDPKSIFLNRTTQAFNTSMDSNIDISVSLNIVGELKLQLEKLEKDNIQLAPHEIAHSLFCLCFFSFTSVDLKAVVSMLTSQAANCFEQFSGEEVADAMFCLQKTEGENKEAQALLATFLKRVRNSEMSNPDQLVRILLGIQNFSSDVPDAIAVVAAIDGHIGKKKFSFSPSQLALAASSLKQMKSAPVEVENILITFARLLKNSSDPLSVQDICNFLLGCQSMNTEQESVRSLLSVVAARSQSCTDNFFSQEIAECFYRLAGFSAESVEVRAIVSMLAAHLANARGRFSDKSIAIILFGIKDMPTSLEEVRSVLSLVDGILKKSPVTFSSDVLLFLSSFMHKFSSDSPEVTSLIGTLKLSNVSLPGTVISDGAILPVNQRPYLDLYRYTWPYSAHLPELKPSADILPTGALRSRRPKHATGGDRWRLTE